MWEQITSNKVKSGFLVFFFVIFVVMSAAAGVLLLLLARPIVRLSHGRA